LWRWASARAATPDAVALVAAAELVVRETGAVGPPQAPSAAMPDTVARVAKQRRRLIARRSPPLEFRITGTLLPLGRSTAQEMLATGH